MQQNKVQSDRCILFPQTKEAVNCIESKELDSRYVIDVIDLTYSQSCKLEIFGFFDFSKNGQSQIKENSFVKLNADDIHLSLESALSARKQTEDQEMVKVIDKFIEKANHSKIISMPIWFNT